jgi:hypothetical protein
LTLKFLIIENCKKSFVFFSGFELSLPDYFWSQNFNMSLYAALFILNVDDFCLEVWIGNSALPQLVHLIFATCMTWFRKNFAAPDGYSCNWFAVVSQRARHVVAKHMPMRPLVHRSLSARRG